MIKIQYCKSKLQYWVIKKSQFLPWSSDNWSIPSRIHSLRAVLWDCITEKSGLWHQSFCFVPSHQITVSQQWFQIPDSFNLRKTAAGFWMVDWNEGFGLPWASMYVEYTQTFGWMFLGICEDLLKLTSEERRRKELS